MVKKLLLCLLVIEGGAAIFILLFFFCFSLCSFAERLLNYHGVLLAMQPNTPRKEVVLGNNLQFRLFNLTSGGLLCSLLLLSTFLPTSIIGLLMATFDRRRKESYGRCWFYKEGKNKKSNVIFVAGLKRSDTGSFL